MTNDTRRQGVLFQGLAEKPVVAHFDQAYASSDGGALLLKAIDEQLNLSASLAACLRDDRQASKVQHSYQDLLQQRMFAMACGYADCNDASKLSNDPVHKLLAGRDPIEGCALGSQPTLSRFENAIDAGSLLRMSEALADVVIAQHKRRRRQVKRITLDFDPTDDATHGSQQLSLFNRHYDHWCYLPLSGFLQFDDEVDQYLFACVLRPGTVKDKVGLLAILKRVVPKLRRAFPRAKLLVRLDSGFTGPELYDYFEAAKLQYVVGMSKNPVLERLAEPLMGQVRCAEPGERRYGKTKYKARSWKRERTVVIKAEVLHYPGREPKENARFVVTNLKNVPRRVYAIYCGRGDVENRIKELKLGMQVDRTSCTSFLANQMRVLMASAAYVLMQTLRLKARGTRFARGQVETLRHLLKFGAWLEGSVRRIVVHLPSGCPFARDWTRIARSVGAVPT